MKTRPIIFNAEMVRALLDGRKTQTRRVVKPQPDFADQPKWVFGDGHGGPGWYCGETEYPDEGSVHYRCPYGVPGDRLYVREGHRLKPTENGWEVAARDGAEWLTDCCVDEHQEDIDEWSRWRPSIHMPRWASRITLEVVDVRVERVGDISDKDAIAEGIRPSTQPGGAIANLLAFAQLWDSINSKKPGRDWVSNPWVWCISFRVVP